MLVGVSNCVTVGGTVPWTARGSAAHGDGPKCEQRNPDNQGDEIGAQVLGQQNGQVTVDRRPDHPDQVRRQRQEHDERRQPSLGAGAHTRNFDHGVQQVRFRAWRRTLVGRRVDAGLAYQVVS
jgi:hypothetical protein